MSMTTHSLPSHFGRATVIPSDHRKIAAMLHQLESICDALANGAWQRSYHLDPLLLLSELNKKLTLHFAAEEADNYFGAIIRERSFLVVPIASLRADHTHLLELLAKILAVAADQERWDELPSEVAQLARELRTHEREESALIEEFLTEADS